MGAVAIPQHRSELFMPAVDPELEAIRSGDERAFDDLTRRHYPAMMRVAMAYVRDRDEADDVIQETWVHFLRRLGTFEGRSSLRTWLFGILTNVARARKRRGARIITFTSLFALASDSRLPTVDPKRFGKDGAWQMPPSSWSRLPDQVVEGKETLSELMAAINGLPPRLRQVIVLRDVAGWSGEEVGKLLRISIGNQRVRLHRARAVVRQKLEEHLR
jgi:RNA polymerase sigma-70 factor, ECF subfamily